MNNLHISLTNFTNESRVLKEVKTISSLPYVQNIYIAALHGNALETDEVIAEKITLKRLVIHSRNLGKNPLFQLVKYVEFISKVVLYSREKNISLVNVHSLALLPLGYLIKLIFRAKLVYDAHELETEVEGLKGIKKLLSRLVESILIKKSDQIFVVSENIADWYQEKYEITRPTVLLNAPKIQKIKKNEYFKNKFNLRDGQIIVLYQGLLGAGRGVDLLLQAFMNRADDKVVIVFMGYGDLEETVQYQAQKHNTIFFHPAVSPEGLLNITASADFGVSLIENSCLSYYYCMPNKLFEYLMAGLPVIVSNLKEMSEFVEKYQIGWVVDSLSVASLNMAMDKLHRVNAEKYKNNIRRAWLENSWERQESKMQDAYDCLLGEK